MRRICFFVLVLLVLFSGQAFADRSGHITLLAVSDSGDGNLTGSTADLYLTVVPGSGKVFLETFPLSKVDTQISTRFAKETACNFLDVDCSKYDFFYTIRSKASIIGGPSAGSAVAGLTVAVLEGKEVDSSVAISGTINSGDLVGPVGHLKDKIFAASQNGIETILIPAGQRMYDPLVNMIVESNETEVNETGEGVSEKVDLVEFGSSIGVDVVEVLELGDVMFYLTGDDYSYDVGEIPMMSDYSSVMSRLAEDLCSRADNISGEIDGLYPVISNESLLADYESAFNLTLRADDAILEGDDYSAASFCFTAGLEFRQLLYVLEDVNSSFIDSRALDIAEDIYLFEDMIDAKERETITDLQAYMIVKERISEAKDILRELNSSSELAYVEERFFSAKSWSSFFGVSGMPLKLDVDSLRESCMGKLNEVEERSQFVGLIFPGVSKGIRDNLDVAYDYFDDGEYALCLFKASKTKAEANVLMSALGVGDAELGAVIDNKFLIAEKYIARQASKGLFPIIAYSYYEYGLALKESDRYSALVYSEYALELSDLDRYFARKKVFDFGVDFDFWKVWILCVGLLLGFILGRAYRPKFVKKQKFSLHFRKNSKKLRNKKR